MILYRVKLRKMMCPLPGLHVCEQQRSVCKATTLKDKVRWKDLHFLDWNSSAYFQSVALLCLSVLSRCTCMVYRHRCLVMLSCYLSPVLPALPGLACCVSP